MMILSRIWYVILGLLLAAAYYVVSLAVGQYNRRNQSAMDETLKADSQVVSWALQVDARRRLDTLLLPAVDANIAKALTAANGKETVPPAARDEGAKALRAFNEKLPAEYKNDVLFLTDREGRLVSQTGFDAVNGSNDFELGGYPAVFDALHGFLRDDTWVWGGRIARVVARPVEADVSQPPLGAVVALRWVDPSFAKEIGKRTRTNVAFFALGQRVASAASTEGFDEQNLEALGSDLKAVTEDKTFKETGRSDVRPLGTDLGGALFVRLPGETTDLGGGFAVARQKVAISSPLGFLQGADDADKRNVKLWLVAVMVLGAALVGFLLTFLEHARPLKGFAAQTARLKKGEIDQLHVPSLGGGYRGIGTDINDGIQRVVEKGGGKAIKPADLESILGPVPAQPSMSAFSFPDSQAGPPPSAPGAPPPPGARFGNAPPPSTRTPAAPPAPGARPPVPGAPAHAAPPPPSARQSAPGMAAAPPRPMSNDEEETQVAARPSAGGDGEGSAEWKAVYEDFLRTKRECNEPVDGLTFEKFQQTLKKNRDALIQRHGCKRVKFAVYVKEGRASLKATPVRD